MRPRFERNYENVKPKARFLRLRNSLSDVRSSRAPFCRKTETPCGLVRGRKLLLE